MKKVLLLLLVLAFGATALFAQDTVVTDEQSPYTPSYVSASGRMETSRGDLELNGRKLSDNEIFQLLGEGGFARYEAASHQRTKGRTFISVGAPLLAVGDILMTAGVIMGYTSYAYHEYLAPACGCLIVGAVMGLTGTGLVAAGIPNMIVGNKRLNGIADEFNAANGYASTVSFGPTPSGFGLALKF